MSLGDWKMDRSFLWYHANGDGTATVYEDTPAVRALIDAGGRDWFGNPEGAIIHGGVLACAFTRRTEPTYDAGHWLRTNELVPMGEYAVTTITAEPRS